jgi:oligoendopeptidase F
MALSTGDAADMLTPRRQVLLSGILIASCVSGTGAQERTRATTPIEYQWNLTDLYASDDAWRAERARLEQEIPNGSKYAGTLGQSAARLQEALDVSTDLDKALNRLATYAGLKADEDTRVADAQGMRDQVIQLGAKFGAAWAFLEPEVLAMDAATVDKWIASTPGLTQYSFYLHDILRRKAHTLSASEEALMAQAAPMAAGSGTSASILLNADLPWPTVTLASGKQVRLDVSGFSAARASANREDRKKVMDAFFNALGSYRRTLGATMTANVQGAMFRAKARHYGTTLEAGLDGANIPTSVYKALVDSVNRQLPSFQRYLKLRTRILGLSELHYYDLYAPLVADVPLTYTVEQAQTNIKAALAPLGADYVAGLDTAFKNRWIDYYPTQGKKSGAYMNPGAYDVHPYLLMNFNGQYADMSALAHELGHGMHSYFASKSQPYATVNAPIFVAEVASTFNEALLIEKMLKDITDPKSRLALLGNYLENVKGTVFRQSQFAEFELRMHEMAESGQPLTGDALSKLYLDITRKYYGHDARICIVDDYVAHEWAYISHFYTPFYVYQYATSFTASTALSEKVISGDPEAVKRYRAFLASGGSQYPIDLLKTAGVDMTTSEPLDLTIRKMDRVMDEIEKLIK